MPRVAILGPNGMLGRAMRSEFDKAGLEFLTVGRNGPQGVDANQPEIAASRVLGGLDSGDFVVNCIGLTKSKIEGITPQQVSSAVLVNSLFPLALAEAANKRGIKLVQIVTDCVFSGSRGSYLESDVHDPIDIYGKTKSLGEPVLENTLNLRCSFIGPEMPGRNSLFFEWVRQLPKNTSVKGYTNHLWNGVTSQTAAAIVSGLVMSSTWTSGTRHIVPRGTVTKFELIQLVASRIGRKDIRVEEHKTEVGVDRTLDTRFPEFNLRAFQSAGFSKVPNLTELVASIEF